MKLRGLSPPLIAAALLAPCIVAAQIRMESSVVGSGATAAVGGQMGVFGTIGQTLIGPATSSALFSGQGFWYTVMRRIINGVHEEYTNDVSSETKLWQNTPNPFSSSTSLQISIPKETWVSLKLYDGLGREVRSLIDGERPAGTIMLQIGAEDLESGSYTVQLIANGVRRNITMVVVK